MRGHEMSIANLRFQEAHTTNALAAVSNDLLKATDQIKVMELALASGAAQVGGDSLTKQEMENLGAKVKSVEGQINLIKNRLALILLSLVTLISNRWLILTFGCRPQCQVIR